MDKYIKVHEYVLTADDIEHSKNNKTDKVFKKLYIKLYKEYIKKIKKERKNGRRINRN
jgi:hypothetical protein